MSNRSIHVHRFPASLACALVAGLLSAAAAQESAPNRSAKLHADPSSRNAATGAINRALDEKTSAEFMATPLADMANLLSDKHGIPVQLDRKALRDWGIESDTLVTAHLENVSLRSLLTLILYELDCTYVVQDEVLLITTRDEANQRVETVVYDVLDLLKTSEADVPDSHLDYDSLSQLIVSTIAPTTWEGSGPMTFAHLDGMFVIPQSQEVHRQIAKLLADLRKVRAARPPTPEAKVDDAPDRVSLRAYSVQASMLPTADAARPRTPDPRYLETLADIIRATIEPQSWSEAGGDGVMRALPANEWGVGTLVVKQTGATHDQIDKLLKDLREQPRSYLGGLGF